MANHNRFPRNSQGSHEASPMHSMANSSNLQVESRQHIDALGPPGFTNSREMMAPKESDLENEETGGK